MELAMRTMRPGDWPAVQRIYQAAMDTGTSTFDRQCPPYEEWDAGHVQACRLVAELDGAVVGWAALRPISARPVYAGVGEVSVYIDAAARGKCIGYALLARLCEEAEREGFWTLQSGIFATNTASIRLHEKCGFRMVGWRERIGRGIDGNWRDTVLMEWRNGIE